MQLLTKELLERFNQVGCQDGQDAVVIAKFFNPCGSATWYATEYYPEDKVFFGYVTGIFENEFGYFSLIELESIKGALGIGIERDRHFEECRFSALLKKLGKDGPRDEQITPLREKLQGIGYSELHTIKGFVANFLNESSSDDEELECLIHDILSHGCISGVFTDLIYYAQTHAFFDNHYDEIMKLRSHIEEDMGISLKSGNDIENSLAWFVADQVTSELASELGIDV